MENWDGKEDLFQIKNKSKNKLFNWNKSLDESKEKVENPFEETEIKESDLPSSSSNSQKVNFLNAPASKSDQSKNKAKTEYKSAKQPLKSTSISKFDLKEHLSVLLAFLHNIRFNNRKIDIFEENKSSFLVANPFEKVLNQI